MNIYYKTNLPVRNSPAKRELCRKCLRAKVACYCGQLRPFGPLAKFVILIHPKEFRKTTGTGRMTFLSLLGAELICDISFDQNQRLQTLLLDPLYRAYVLYPGPSAIEINESTSPKIVNDAGRPLIIVVDGSWPCAKKMMKQSKTLQELPRLSFSTSKKSQYKIHLQPDDLCLSTIESVAVCLKKLGQKSADIEKLLQPFRWMVQYNVEASRDPNRTQYRPHGYRFLDDETPIPKSKKWQQRALFFDETNFQN